MSFFVALFFTFSVFSMMPVSAHHADADTQTHHAVSVDNHTTSDHQKDGNFHVEHCGVASCSMSLPGFFTYASTIFGAKVLFEVNASQLTSLHLLPTDRPPIS
ncbi:MAG: hypothetical protein V7723_15185 [Sneathiella sp.]|uniref:hypothetical protein n=1 Tax=Sneathiella sp. TaxID=1964365 RepID=UPI003001B0C6